MINEDWNCDDHQLNCRSRCQASGCCFATTMLNRRGRTTVFRVGVPAMAPTLVEQRHTARGAGEPRESGILTSREDQRCNTGLSVQHG